MAGRCAGFVIDKKAERRAIEVAHWLFNTPPKKREKKKGTDLQPDSPPEPENPDPH